MAANCALFLLANGSNCDPRLFGPQKIQRAGGDFVPPPTNFRLPPTSSGGLDLISLRARCKGEGRAAQAASRELEDDAVRKLRLFLYATACLPIASDVLEAESERCRRAAGTKGTGRGEPANLCCAPGGPQEQPARKLHAKSGKRSVMEALAGRHVVVTGGGRGDRQGDRGTARGRGRDAFAARAEPGRARGGRGPRRRRRARLRHPRPRRRRRRVRRGRAARGPVHALVANSGVGGANADGPDDRFEEIVQTNLFGTYWCIRAAVRHLAAGAGARGTSS